MNSSLSKSTVERWLLILPGWTIACAMVYAGATDAGISWNLFDWTGPKLDTATLIFIVLSVAGIGCLLGLGKHLNTLDLQIATALPAALLTVQAGIFLRGYFTQNLGTGIFAAKTYSPLWFHLLVSGDLAMPALIWLAFVVRNTRMRSRLRPATFESPGNIPDEPVVKETGKSSTPWAAAMPDKAASASLVCPKCQRLNPGTSKFCAQCGTPLMRISGD